MPNNDAIKWLESIDKKYIHGGDEWYDEQRHEAIKTAIRALENERPKGKWVLIDDPDDPLDQLNRYKCSECGRIIRIYDWQTFADYPFCQCGADMRKETENE